MSKLFFVISFCAIIGIDRFVDEDRIILLANATNKDCYLYSSTPESSTETCRSDHAIASDNTYIFYADGTFKFDHGTITEDEACTNEDCCNDLVNITGKWKFTNNQKKIRITALHETGNESNALTMVLFNATIDQLDENVLKISQTDSETNIVYTYEFRKK